MEDELPPSIERIMGEDFSVSQPHGSQNLKSSPIDAIKLRHTEVISNSNSPLENERIKRDYEANQNKDKIEIHIELTADQKK